MVLSKNSIISLTLATFISTSALSQERTTDGNSSTVTYRNVSLNVINYKELRAAANARMFKLSLQGTF